MRWRAVEVEVVFFNVLAVVALAVGQAEEALLEDGVAAVPECQRKTEHLFVVADTGKAVLTPVVGARARLVMTEVCPGITILAVILTHRAPLALAKIRAPLAPRNAGLTRFRQPGGFGIIIPCPAVRVQ